MSALLELAARCEAATGPDRELDAEIWLACVPGSNRSKSRYFHIAPGREWVVNETRDANRRLIVVPTYSASLDAAMTLAGDDPYSILFEAMVRCPFSETDGARFLALLPCFVTASALRARAAIQPSTCDAPAVADVRDDGDRG